MSNIHKYCIGFKNIHTGFITWFEDYNGNLLGFSNDQASKELRLQRNLFGAIPSRNTKVIAGFKRVIERG